MTRVFFSYHPQASHSRHLCYARRTAPIMPPTLFIPEKNLLCHSGVQTATRPCAYASNRSLHVCNRLLFVRMPKSLQASWPIRTQIRTHHLSSRQSRQRRILKTNRRVTLKHARLRQHIAQGCNYWICAFPSPLIVFGHQAFLILGTKVFWIPYWTFDHSFGKWKVGPNGPEKITLTRQRLGSHIELGTVNGYHAVWERGLGN